ncbi:hypothetical protein A3A64_00810 [Candidatus Gottesmanbacteria bacterium RIFCSPLOWO2_01_FULL_48_11]|uniref:N-acetylglucosaminyltransferase n=2 Tax=Candidatus Gottesmaniibacteriota TaxID=1752720 RepID=A0A0G1U209_9BACT|nr:MAG: hypothetical protein UY16_C0013G0014 [Candidatus Gottesmanbacteria bacterium GW2011_GWA2_47_9]OGG28489.1 MAG: hypothetical protein A3A64_00810 [Candidatus Gottesmanbacteria bacterium RIFCSPLOWO2_01_FULL_48_11]
MKIFDCFLFFNELELLELRLMTLHDVVDYFVLVEANKTFTDKPKDFLFEKNKKSYKKYLNKIIHVKVEDTPMLDRAKNAWAIEEWQRNCITRGLATAKDEDRVIVSDVDEIPDPDRVMQVKDSNTPVTFKQCLFYYFVNCWGGRDWNGSVMTPYKNMMVPYRLKGLARKGLNRIKNSGWHYTYMGGVKNIRLKLNNLSDAYTRRDQVGNDEDILRKIMTQKDLWDEHRAHTLVNIDEKGYAPLTIKTFLATYPSFHFGPLP